MLKSIITLTVLALSVSAHADQGQLRVAAAQARFARATQPSLDDLGGKTLRCISLLNNAHWEMQMKVDIESLNAIWWDGNHGGDQSLYLRPYSSTDLRSDDGQSAAGDTVVTAHYEFRKDSATKYLIDLVTTVTTAPHSSVSVGSTSAIPEAAPKQTPATIKKSVMDAWVCLASS